MTLAQADIEQIETLIERCISKRPETLNANVRYELDLRERTIRVEEELKHQHELMSDGFRQMEKRFEQMGKRFEQADKPRFLCWNLSCFQRKAMPGGRFRRKSQTAPQLRSMPWKQTLARVSEGFHDFFETHQIGVNFCYFKLL